MKCTHLPTIRSVTPSADGCEECLKSGETWVHLRICRTCGHVGCCDSSKNKHATRHFQTVGHPVMGEQIVPCKPRLIFSDPEAMAQAARLGLGVALLPMPFAFASIQSGELVRLLPGWYSDAGPISLYYPSRKMLPAKTRVFVDYILERFRQAGFARLVDAR